ncbi:anti-sigma factor domain-containing protein [Bacillus sp. CLL-7-23]|uniref:Anti-sigma factor domain-containing protein n=1 Tax=Bacillus changyiensis TaxID=3004103 RepID=A0ABT4X1P5_9BACI|nr:anti-sigma factor domain-containing protein [Bacillus changyiensis]MDA7026203.1 anti-sigma factor domain-containing protein [Bacillus changyiensis]
MRRGIVVEKNKKCVTLLTPDGHFLKAKKTEGEYEIGQEIGFPSETRMERKRAGFFDLLSLRSIKAGVFSIAAIMLFAFMFIPDFFNNKAYAYMTIDINPSFELALNKDCEVVGLVALNEDGKDLINSIENWEKSDFKEVISEIVEDSDKQGYVKDSKEVLITTVYENNEDDSYKTIVKSEIADVTEKYENQNFKMKLVESDMGTREKAQKEGVSTGRYIRSHEKETKDQDVVDDQEKKSDQHHKDEDKKENKKEEGIKDEDQPEQHSNDEESKIEDQPDDDKKTLNRDETGSDQKEKKNEETITPKQNPQDKNNDKEDQQLEEGSSEDENVNKAPSQKDKKTSDQENPPRRPGE